MPIAINPEETLTEVVRGESFTATITVTADEEEIENVTAILQGDAEPQIIITPKETSVDISGKYLDPFLDVFKYVEKGSSDLIEAPKEVVSLSNLPPNKDFFNLDQDTRNIVTKTYTVTVTYDGGNTEEFTITQDILNTLDAIKDFVESYYE